MKWLHSELLKGASKSVSFDEDVLFDETEFQKHSWINGVKDVHVKGTGFLEETMDRFYAQMHITGTMLVPDAITLEEIEYPFECDSEEVYAFEPCEEEDVRVVDDEIDLFDAIKENILMEVPIRVTNVDPKDYPKGDGWQILSEEDYRKSQEDQLDPRLAKLKEYKNQDE